MEDLTREKCNIILKKYYDHSNFEIVKSVLSPPVNSFGFIGVLKKLQIKVKELENDNLEELTFFVKHIKEDEFHREVVKELGSFLKECNMYDCILPKLAKYIDGQVCPKCYYCEDNSLLVLEDLSSLGFKTKAPNEFLDEKHCQMTLEVLAKFHAASIIYEEKNKTNLNKDFSAIVTNDPFRGTKGTILYQLQHCSIKTLKGILESYFTHIPPQIKDKALDLLAKVIKMVNAKSNLKCTLSHGDMWSNNVMFKYNNEGNLEDVRLIDFQGVRYAMPALDVLFFLYTSTTHSFREKHMSTLILHYYDSLRNELSKQDLDIQNILSWDDFKLGIEELIPAALSMAVIYMNLVMLPLNDTKAIMDEELYKKILITDRTELVLSVMDSDSQYRNHIIEGISELIEYAKNH